MNRTLNGLGCERLTVDSTAGGVALASIPQGAIFALIRVKSGTGAICFTDDGVTAPTSSVGMELEAGDTLAFDGQLHNFKAIRRDTSNGTLIVNYYGRYS